MIPPPVELLDIIWNENVRGLQKRTMPIITVLQQIL